MLIVETGSGASDAESFAAVSQADQYLAARGFTLWSTMSEAEKEQALRRGTDHMLRSYRGRWKGERATSTQALDWPRVGAEIDRFDFPGDQIPIELRRASIEMAWRAAYGELQADEGPQVLSKTVGPITVQYAPGARQNKKFAAVDDILRPLLRNGGGMTLTRA